MMKIGVIGVGRFGYHVAATLADNGVAVLAVDGNDAVIAAIRDKVAQAICLRVNDEEALRSIGIDAMDTVIVAMGDNFAQSILVTAILKQKLGTNNVIARAISQIHKEILTLVGADQVILPEKEMGIRLADALSLSFKAPVTRVTPTFSIIQLPAPKKFVGKKLKDIKLYEHYHVVCVGHKFNEEIIVTSEEYIMSEGDVLFFAGNNEHIEKLAKL